MSHRDSLDELRATLAEIHHIGSAAALLSWDQETCMPPRGVAGRGPVLATLAGLAHGKLADGLLGDLLDKLSDCADLGPQEQALIRETRRDRDRAVKIPERLVKELAQARSNALPAWQQARMDNRFVDFAPHLERLLNLKRQVAEAVGYEETPFDALLDEYERGARESTLRALLSRLRSELQPFVKEVLASSEQIDSGPVRRRFDPDTQKQFATEIVRAMGFDLQAGRIDRSAHPFCTGIHPGDVRLTWRFTPDDLRPALFGIIHEAGHGLYEQGLPQEWSGTPLGEAASLGIHESQSRLWENMIARSLPFWNHFLPRLQQRFPGLLDDVDAQGIYRAVNAVTPSLIRVEADELTYNLHIVLRFEIECDLFAGRLAVSDLPEAWAAKMDELLGIRPDSDANGVLQDIHWAMGAFGYFPTYTLGNLYAAQLFAAAREQLGDLDELIGQGNLSPLRQWLGKNIHCHGRRFEPAELVRRATGKAPDQEAYMRYVRDKFSAIYHLS